MQPSTLEHRRFTRQEAPQRRRVSAAASTMHGLYPAKAREELIETERVYGRRRVFISHTVVAAAQRRSLSN
jgi:hypothetical protein